MTRRRVPKPTPDPYPVRVVRSRKRKRTVSARLIEGVLELTVPAWLSDREAAEFADRMQARFARKRTSASSDLTERASTLASRYDLPRPTSVRWVGNQQARWGSCSIDDGSIRLSDRMIGMPEWVVDAVLVHELAHLVHADHGAAFKALEARYERQVEASAFLDGVVWAAGQRHIPTESADDASPVDHAGAADRSAVEHELCRDDAIELEGLDGGFDLGQLCLDLPEQLRSEPDRR